ncbi:MAG: hypothetical protein AAGB01_03570 [Cyanobacteria bacterium P01_F01_bin.42]
MGSNFGDTDHDLAIIGDSFSARWAALAAARLHARVALVIQAQISNLEIALPFVLRDLSNRVAIAEANKHPLPFHSAQDLSQWMHRRGQQHLQHLSLHRLQFHGVDVLREPGVFIEAPVKTSVFQVQARRLRVPHYLLALPARGTDSATDSATNLPDFLDRLQRLEPGDPICLFCSQPWVILLGRTLHRLGHPVTLIYEQSLLPTEDADLSFFIQCALESAGIIVQPTLITTDTVNQSSYSATFRPLNTIDYKSLMLERAAISWTQSNESLQFTTALRAQNSRFYGCGAVLRHEWSDVISQRETAIAVRNALFQTNEAPAYDQWPYSLPIGQQSYRVGLTEAQARRRLKSIEIMTRGLETGDDQIFCKLIMTGSGKIIGIHAVGQAFGQAHGEIEAVLGRLVQDLVDLSLSSPVLTMMFQDFAHRWTQMRQPKIRDRRERYFRRKRKRFS